MTLFIIGAVLIAAGIAIIFSLRNPEEDRKERVRTVTGRHALWGSVVMTLIVVGGGMMALAVF